MPHSHGQTLLARGTHTIVPMTDLAKPAASPRLVSLDAYRGFIMLAMVTEGCGFPQVAKKFPDKPVWQFLGHQFEHVEWLGCSFWDLIQPAFMFMVGVSMAYSYASRQAKGQTYRRMFGHAVYRALVLVLLGIFLYSNRESQTNFVFKNVLAQIGLGYVFLFLLWNRPRWLQAIAAAAILVGYWVWFAMSPLPPEGFNYRSVGLPKNWQHLTGFEAHWDKATNAAASFDQWFLNLFPRKRPFVYDGGGYHTLSFIPALATMIFGLMTGELLRGSRTGKEKLLRLIGWGLAGILGGTLIAAIGVCPMVKRIWTPTFGLYSTGWVLLMLAAFYAAIDLWGKQRWTWPLVIVGVNSLAIYLMDQLLRPWMEKTLKIHFGPKVFDIFGEDYYPIAQHLLIVLCFWLACFWMYRQKIFVKI
jgi:heparan-alpha-glucosaminide N-acetyltransferase